MTRRTNEMQLKAGTRLKSRADDTQVVVVRAPADEVEVTAGIPE